jgi:hypothetical protein
VDESVAAKHVAVESGKYSGVYWPQFLVEAPGNVYRFPVDGQEEVSLQQYRRHSGSHGGWAVARPSNTAQLCCDTSHAARPLDERGRIEHLRGNFPIGMPFLQRSSLKHFSPARLHGLFLKNRSSSGIAVQALRSVIARGISERTRRSMRRMRA